MDMNALKVLSVKCPNISAQRIYVGLYMLNDDNFGTLREVSYEWLAVKLEEMGFRTERGDRFTRRTVWGRVNELCRAGLADVDKNRDGSLDITIFAAGVASNATSAVADERSNATAVADESSTVTAVASNASGYVQRARGSANPLRPAARSDMESTTQNGTEFQENFACDTKEEYNNININKQINKISLKEAIAKVDFSNPRVARFREKVARAAYETNMHADLIDRAVAAVALGYATSAELKAAIEASKDSQRQLQSTNGFKGKRYIWQTLTLYVKSWFDAVGLRWIPTSFRREPAPKPLVKINTDSPLEDDVTTDEKGRTIIRRR